MFLSGISDITNVADALKPYAGKLRVGGGGGWCIKSLVG